MDPEVNTHRPVDSVSEDRRSYPDGSYARGLGYAEAFWRRARSGRWPLPDSGGLADSFANGKIRSTSKPQLGFDGSSVVAFPLRFGCVPSLRFLPADRGD